MKYVPTKYFFYSDLADTIYTMSSKNDYKYVEGNVKGDLSPLIWYQ